MDFNWPFRIMESHNEGNKLKLDVDKVEWIKFKGDETRGRGRTWFSWRRWPPLNRVFY